MNPRAPAMFVVGILAAVVLAACSADPVGEDKNPEIGEATAALTAVLTDTGLYGNVSNPTYLAANSLGDIVGQNPTTHVAALWNNGTTTSLGTLGGSDSGAAGINDSGLVIGWSYLTGNTVIHGFRWQSGTLTDFGSSIPTAVNNAGQVVGSMPVTVGGVPYTHAFVWQSGTTTDLGSGAVDSEAYAISPNGTILGKSGSSFVLWKGGSSTTISGISSASCTRVYGVNDSGQVVGRRGCSPQYAFIWQNGVVRDLAVSNTNAAAYGINYAGQVVGTYTEQYTGFYLQHAFLWQNGVFTDLNLLPGISSNVLRSAIAIGESGQVVGDGSFPAIPAYDVGYQLILPMLRPQVAETKPEDKKIHATDNSPAEPTAAGACGNGFGMCVPNAHELAASLSLTDTPVGYAPPKGPPVFARLSYSHRGTTPIEDPTFSNVGPNWTLNTLSYVTDDPATPGDRVMRYVAGGGSVDYAAQAGSFNTGTGAWGAEKQTFAVLTRVPATGSVTSYTLTFPDGTKHTYAQLDGASTYPRRVFLTEIKDPAGNALTFNYTSLKLTSITDAAGRSTTFTYGNATYPLQPTQITDPFSRSATLSYTEDYGWQNCTGGQLCKITDVVGIESLFQYDTTDPTLISTLTTPYGVTSFSAGADATTGERWLEISDPLGFTERVEYKPDAATGVTATETIPTGITALNGSYNKGNSFFWNKHIYPTYGTGAGKDYTQARITHWLTNAAGQPVGTPESVKEPLENRVFFNYDGQPSGGVEGTSDQPIKTARILPGGSTQLYAKTYNSLGNALTETDPLGRVTKYTYYSNGIDLQTVEQKISSTPTYATLASFGTYTAHRPASSTDAAGKTTSYTYNGAGQLTQVTDPLSQVTKYQYDGSSRLQYVKKTISGSDVTLLTLAYNSDDQVSSRTDSEGHAVSYTYDDLDRVLTETFPDATYNQWEYDALSMWHSVDRLGHERFYGYDGAQMLQDIYDENGNITHYEYYGNGTLSSLTQFNDDRSLQKYTYWDIDVQGRTVGMSMNPNGDGYGLSFDAAGRPSVRTDGLGQTRTYAYDAADELTGITYGGVINSTPNVTFAYDTWYPRRTSMTDGLGTTAWSYVAAGTTCSGGSTTNCGAGQLSSENGPFTSNDTVSYVYDELARLKSRTVGSDAESFTYDIQNRVTAHTTTLGTFNYTFNGRTQDPLTRTLGTTGVKLTYTYGNSAADRRLATITASQLAASNTARSFTLTSNARRITAISEGALASTGWSGGGLVARGWAYGYDNTDKLTSGALTPSGGSTTTYSYAYDYGHNISTFEGASGTINEPNQLTAIGARSLTYDIEGNATNDGSHATKYDAENRVVEIGLGGSNKVTFAYDGLGRRAKITTVIGGTTTESRLAWCGDKLCQQRNSSDTVTRRYVAEGEVRPSGTNLVYLQDHLGTVRAVTNTSGALQWAADYKPYGATYQTFGSTPPDFRYAGLLWQNDSSLYLSNTRVYDPTIGRWLSRDPIGIDGGVNLYQYAAGNPIKHVDRDGKSPVFVGLAVGAAGGAILGAGGEYFGNPNATLKSVAAAGKSGAVVGGLAGAAGAYAVLAEGAALLVSAGRAVLAVGAAGASGGAASLAIDYATDQPYDWQTASKAAALTAGITAAGPELATAWFLPQLELGAGGAVALQSWNALVSTTIGVGISRGTTAPGTRAGGYCPIRK